MCVCVCRLRCFAEVQGCRTRFASLCDISMSSFDARSFVSLPSITPLIHPVHPSLHHSIWLKELPSILKVRSPCQLKTNLIASGLCVCLSVRESCSCLHVHTYLYETRWTCVCECVGERSERLMQLRLFHSPLRSLCWPPDPKASNMESIIMTIGLHIYVHVWVWWGYSQVRKILSQR